MSEPTIRFTMLDGLQTAYTCHGSGPPILMLHGWGADLRLMWPLAEQLAPLGYAIHIPDLPGFGQTPPPPTAWSVHDYVKFVLAYMNDLELANVRLIGHSFGGRLAMILGADQPDRIDKMALINSAGIRPRTSLQQKIRLTTYRTARQTLEAIGFGSRANQLRNWYNHRYGSADFKSAGPLRETFVKVVGEDLLPYAARIQAPTLLFWGDQDEQTPLWQGHLLEKTIPDAGLIIHEGAGHYSYLEKPAETVRILDHFFKQEVAG